jgi:hypothetical protein
MGIIYNDSEPKPAFPINIAKMNPHPGYARHCENYYYLKFIFDHPDTTTREKLQAQKEMAIASRKMDFWYRHHAAERSVMEKLLAQTKKKWNQSDA